jgi:hypothetical protein
VAEVEKFDASQFLVPIDNFDQWMIQEAEAVVKIAAGLYREACSTKNSAKIAAALDNWQLAAKRCREIREGYQKLLEKSENVITVDRAADIVGRELAVLQQLLDDLPARLAAELCPEDPARHLQPIQAAVVEIYKQMNAAGAAMSSAAVLPEPSAA